MPTNTDLSVTLSSENDWFSAYSQHSLQTESEHQDKAPEAPGFPQTGSAEQDKAPEVPGFPQTGLENQDKAPEAPGFLQTGFEEQDKAPEVTGIPQTDFETLPNGLSLHRNIRYPQTGLGVDALIRTNSSETQTISSLKHAFSQTGIETRVNSTRAIPEAAGAEIYPESGLNSLPELTGSAHSSGGRANLSPADTKPASQETRRPRRRTRQSQSGESGETNSSQAPPRSRRAQSGILSIDEQRSVETREDKLRNDLLDLVESQKGRKILTGIIQGVERSADNPNQSFAVIYRGEFKIIIPSEETVSPPGDLRGRSLAEVLHFMVTRRLGAEVDYIVKGVDINSGIAAASRLEAMAIKSKQYYNDTDRNGNYLIYEGLPAEARVVCVIRAGMFVDLFGREIYIPLRELSYQRWVDAAAHFQPGQRVLVKILKLDRSERGNIQVTASVKQAAENPYEQALKRYTPGSRYVGTVSMVDTNGVFVSLDGGVDCLCSYPKRGRPPRGSMVTVVIIGVNHDANHIWGAITHVTSTI